MTRRINCKRILFVLTAGLPVFPLLAIGAPEFTVNWHTVDGGGVQSSSGGEFELSGTLGQFDARNQPMTGGDVRLAGGFWVVPQCPAIPADYDGDCDVDQADYQLWEFCASGPDVPYSGDCGHADFDDDFDTDQDDFTVFQRCYSGPGVPGNPACAD
jgi:hypothetical protein